LFRKFWSGAIEKLDNVTTKVNTNNISISENPEYLFLISESIPIKTSLPGRMKFDDFLIFDVNVVLRGV
jgi:hypothetical protein